MEWRRLPSYAIEAYDILYGAATLTDDDQQEVSPNAARQALEDADEEFTTADIDHVLELLYNRGEIYHVNDQIRFTAPDEFNHQYHDNEETRNEST